MWTTPPMTSARTAFTGMTCQRLPHVAQDEEREEIEDERRARHRAREQRQRDQRARGSADPTRGAGAAAGVEVRQDGEADDVAEQDADQDDGRLGTAAAAAPTASADGAAGECCRAPQSRTWKTNGGCVARTDGPQVAPDEDEGRVVVRRGTVRPA